MTILCTGAAGMIGSNLCHWLIDNTDNVVIGVDDLSTGFKSNLPKSDRFIFYGHDIRSRLWMEQIFEKHQPSIVYHAAAYAAEQLSPFIRMFNYENNLVGTANIVNCCINFGVSRLVFFSSIAVYGHGKVPFQEWQVPVPNDPYGNAKRACEIDIMIAGDQHKLDWCIVRPYNCYGKMQNIFDKYRNVLGIFMHQYLNDKPFTIFGDGSQKRSFTNVKDILKPLYLAGIAPEASKQIINIGSEVSWTVKEAAEMLQEIICGGEIHYLEARHEVHTAYASNEKAKQILGYQEQTQLYEGLKEMWEWAKKQPMANADLMTTPKYEIQKGIYEAWKK